MIVHIGIACLVCHHIQMNLQLLLLRADGAQQHAMCSGALAAQNCAYLVCSSHRCSSPRIVTQHFSSHTQHCSDVLFLREDCGTVPKLLLV